MFRNFFRKKLKFVISIAVSLILSFTFTSGIILMKGGYFKQILITLEANIESLHYFLSSLMKGNLSEPFKREGVYNNLYILAIDDKTIAKYGRWPFDRKVWADFLNYLNNETHPPLVFFDIIFGEKSRSPESDRALIEAISNYKGVIAEDIIFETFKTTVGSQIYKEEEEFLTKKIVNEGNDYFSPRIQALKKYELSLNEELELKSFAKVSPMMEELAFHIPISGSANVDLETTPITKVPLIVSCYYYYSADNGDRLTNIYYPSIVLSMATHLFKTDLKNIELGKNKVVIKNANINGRKTDIVIPVDESYRLKINYKSKPSSGFIKLISFSEYSRYSFSSNDIIFLGMYSTKGAYDIKQTPFGNMYGIEVNAYAFGTLMNKDFIVENRDFSFSFIYSFLISSVVGVLVCLGIAFAVMALFITLVLPLVIGLIFFMNGTSILTFIPLITSFIVLVLMQIYMLLTEEKERKWIQSVFSSYVNPKLVDLLIQEPDRVKLGGEERNVTVIFSAIKNFSEFSEKLSPKELVDFLNEYFSRMADIVISMDGTLDKYIGDNVMAFWGAPVEQQDHALKACEAAMKMFEETEKLNRELKSKGLPEINLNIGINTGSVVAGNVGSEQQKNYTAIGDTVNLASRVKGLNKYFHTHIIISESTYEEVKDKIYSRELDLTRVKGKTRPVRVYELIDLKKGEEK